MRTNGLFDERLSPTTTATIESIASADNTTFSALVTISGLDPRTDFRYADLRGVDLGDSDVRGFDFTGADLRGISGVDVLWDRSTILDQAAIAGSLFAYTSSQEEFFKTQPKWHREFLRRRSGDWPSSTIWVADSTKKGAPDREMAVEITKALFDHTSDDFLRSQILFFLAQAFDQRSDHRDFLLHITAKFGQNQTIVRAALRTLSSLFPDDEYVFEFLRRQMKSEDFTTRVSAAEGVIRSAHLQSQLATVAQELQTRSSYLRRMLVRRVAMRRGTGSIDAVTEPYSSAILDYADEVTKDKIERIAYENLIKRHRRRTSGMKFLDTFATTPNFSTNEIARRAVEIGEILVSLRSTGIPFWGSGLPTPDKLNVTAS